jgi:hypothetical protein
MIFESGKFCCARPEQDSKRCHAHRDTACYCCGEVDDPDGKGPAINTGFCAECNTAGCPDAMVGGPCLAHPGVREVRWRDQLMEAGVGGEQLELPAA